jgi:DNA-binding transcriptional ArsR family regulator
MFGIRRSEEGDAQVASGLTGRERAQIRNPEPQHVHDRKTTKACLYKSTAIEFGRELDDDRSRAASLASVGGYVSTFAPTTRFTVMRHLDVLVAAGLVTVERRGRERLNHLNPVPLQQVVERWVRPLAEPTATAVLGLAEAAERETR